MPFVRAYPREGLEIGVRCRRPRTLNFRGACTRGIYDNIWTPLAARRSVLVSSVRMRESIRPGGGAVMLLALMGVRYFWPHNMIGRSGLVVHQASKLRSLPTSHQHSPRIRLRLPDLEGTRRILRS